MFSHIAMNWRGTPLVDLATIVSLIAGTLAALALVRYSFWGREILRAIFLSPLIVPRIAFGVAMLVYAIVLRRFGGLDSLVGALVGSLIVAAAEVVLIHYVDPLLSDVVPFFVLLAMLVVRPWGLFGTREELDRV